MSPRPPLPRKVGGHDPPSSYGSVAPVAAGAPPQTPLGELTVLPKPPAGLRGLLLRGGEEEGRGQEILHSVVADYRE